MDQKLALFLDVPRAQPALAWLMHFPFLGIRHMVEHLQSSLLTDCRYHIKGVARGRARVMGFALEWP